ncbi:prolyl oligopeptidase family serine peptidase [Pseudoalteromonas sp. H71]|uniref:prolyl oligopeptidase family serine peptidase n=1 Tax=Pseudoalteromonas sp. H71 TaxID=1348395 RepID=UPI0007310D7F|nr:prolyl oligopeptidase family serine peptidase [Pseudoalteromonas sp. H71]KTD97793.1 prolyl endopeptidase [Pseudoalteromonas sp. H71]
MLLKRTLACAVFLALSGCSEPTNTSDQKEVKLSMNKANSVVYPETKTGDVVDTYFGENVADPYRWLEDDMSEETADWVNAQNTATFSYLEQIPYRNKLKERLEKLMNYEKIGAPFEEGGYTYFYKNDGLQNQFVLYRSKGDDAPEVFLDPNKFSDDGTTSMSGLSFSEDGSLLAYQVSEGGSDWRKIIVINTTTKEQVEQALVDVKFSGIDWLGNEGFYYSSYDKPKGSELSAKTDQHKVYYHALGTSQNDDRVVFGDSEAQKHRYVGADVTHDGKYLLISASVSTSGNKLFIKDLSKENSDFITVVGNADSDTSVIDNDGDTLYLVTNLNAPNKKVVTVNANDPAPENWVDFIPETDNVLNLSKGGNTFFANYMVDAISQVKQYNKQGDLIREISLPGVGTARGFRGKKDQTTLYYSFTNYKTPGTTFSFDVSSGESKVYRESAIDFNSNDYTSEQVFYTSKDGTKVPMIITYKTGIKLDGSNPTILYGYGGFNVSLTPSFSPVNALWLEQGGVYAVANIRGGGEYGKDWHNAGTKMQKQNVFDDFIAAAEYLQDKKYTSKKRLALRGGSNGGLLVGAVMTQRPDLFQVALPAVGVLDMLRYHTFTAGAGWAYDYGTSEQSKEMFEYIKAYSPLHNVKAGVEYPATMVTTGDHDDRVVPSHSFKFAAELQSKQAGDNPTLIRIETNAGHGAGTPTSKVIDLYADMFGFTLYNMGVKEL